MTLAQPTPPRDDRRGFLTKTAVVIGAAAALPPRLTTPLAAATGPAEWLDITDFGVRGDGVTDDSAALITLRNYMLTKPDTHFRVNVPSGMTVVINNLHWLRQVQRVTFDAYGASFKNILSNSIIGHHHIFDTSAVEGVYVPHFGYLFNSASAGTSSIALTTAGEANNFSIGMRVFLWGYDQQFSGFPPNARYFEWNQIAAINTGTGVLTLVTPLVHDYDDEWWEVEDTPGEWVDQSFGKPRIFSLDRPEYKYPRHIEFMGANFISSSTVAEDAILPIAEYVRFKDCTGDNKMAFFASEQKHVVYENVTALLNTEHDKLVGLCETIGGTWAGIESATGIREMRITGTTIERGTQLSCRKLVLNGCTFNLDSGSTVGPLGLGDAEWSCDSMQLVNNSFTHPGGLDFVVNTNVTRSLTVDGYSGGEILLDDDVGGVNRVVMLRLRIGAILYAPDGSDFGEVTRLRWTGTQFAIAGTWTGPFSADDTLHYHQIGTVTESGSTFNGGLPRRIWRHPRAGHLPVVTGNTRVLTLTRFNYAAQSHLEEFEIFAVLKSIRMTVTGAAGSTLSGFSIIAYTKSFDDRTEFISWQTHVLGEAVVTDSSTSASPSNGALALKQISAGRFYRILRLTFPNPALVGTLPTVAIEVEMELPAV